MKRLSNSQSQYQYYSESQPIQQEDQDYNPQSSFESKPTESCPTTKAKKETIPVESSGQLGQVVPRKRKKRSKKPDRKGQKIKCRTKKIKKARIYCKMCLKECYSTRTLQSHMLTQHLRKKIKCNGCKFQATTDNKFDAHNCLEYPIDSITKSVKKGESFVLVSQNIPPPTRYIYVEDNFDLENTEELRRIYNQSRRQKDYGREEKMYDKGVEQILGKKEVGVEKAEGDVRREE